MSTKCNLKSYRFQTLKIREVISAFDGGAITSDGGGLLLREVEARCSTIGQFSECFTDYRDPDLSEGSVDELDRIVKQIRAAWPEVKITIRGDSGFCREKIMNWCEANDVHYVLGLAKNSRLKKAIGDKLALAKKEYGETGKAARVFKDFTYQTRKSWDRSRRVVGKAEHLVIPLKHGGSVSEIRPPIQNITPPSLALRKMILPQPRLLYIAQRTLNICNCEKCHF